MNPIFSFGPADPVAVEQLERCLTVSGDESRGVLCADHHKGYGMPIGGVIASQSVIMPAGVGYDIACGNCAVRTDLKAADVDVSRIMDEIWKTISFGVGRKNQDRVVDAPVIDLIAHSDVIHQRPMAKLAEDQLGTVGSGNHYVDLFEDRADGALWVGVHFGSRGFGHKTACGFLALAENKEWGAKTRDDMDSVPTTIPIHSDLGQAYLEAMRIAGEYAYAGRDWVVDRVLSILGAGRTFYVHNHHNFAWWEENAGEKWLVVRKGSTPAYPGQLGFIGGSMGDDAVIVEGVEDMTAAASFYSTVHGAGRVMGRKAAAGRTKTTNKWVCRNHRKCSYAGASGGFRTGPNGEHPKCPECGHKLDLKPVERVISPGLIDWPAALQQLKVQGVELRGGGADEAPGAYKRLPEVLAHHAGTIKILHQLRPIGVAMAGPDVHDPYRD